MSSMFCESSGLSYAMANIGNDEDRVTVIVNAFYKKACDVARSRISPKFRCRFSGSSVANSAILGLFKTISNRDLANWTAQDLENVLRAVIKNKIADRVRRHSAEKRAVSRSVSLDAAIYVSATHDPSAQLVADELYEIVVNKLRELHGNGLRLRMAELGLLLKKSGAEIQRTLEYEYPDKRVPRSRSILEKLRDDREVLSNYLKKSWGLHDE